MIPGAAVSSERLIDHRIAVGNLIYGHADFVTLRLPEEWDIAPGVGRPEVVAAHERGGTRWVVTGKAWYVIFHRKLGWAMELFLESRTKRRTPVSNGGERVRFADHPAYVRRWQRKRGLLRPKLITFVEAICDCEQSDRTLRVEFSGRCPVEAFEVMLKQISNWQCH